MVERVFTYEFTKDQRQRLVDILDGSVDSCDVVEEAKDFLELLTIIGEDDLVKEWTEAFSKEENGLPKADFPFKEY